MGKAPRPDQALGERRTGPVVRDYRQAAMTAAR